MYTGFKIFLRMFVYSLALPQIFLATLVEKKIPIAFSTSVLDSDFIATDDPLLIKQLSPYFTYTGYIHD